MEQLETISALVDAIKTHSWYAIAGFAVTLVVSLLRSVAPTAWASLPAWAKPLPAVVLSSSTAFVTAFQAGLPWEQAIGVFIYTAITATLVALGLANAVIRFSGKENPSHETASGKDLE